MNKTSLKFIGLFVMAGLIALNPLGIAQAARGGFDDEEMAEDNEYSVGTLDFSLSSTGDFSPDVAPTKSAARNVDVDNDGTLDFQYQVKADNFSGSLCSHLKLEAFLNGGSSPEYNGDLTSFNYAVGSFSDPDSWYFEVSLDSGDPALKNKTCNFDFVFEGWQDNIITYGSGGFFDTETICNTVDSGSWSSGTDHLVINEVYYDTNRSDENDEFVEIYNPTSTTIDLSNYKVGDEETNGGGEGMYEFPSSTSIGSDKFLVVAKKASGFKNTFGFNPDFEFLSSDPTVPDMIKYTSWASGSLALANGGDEVLLLDNSNLIIDVVTYESGSYAGVTSHPGVSGGHSIARDPAGKDTDNCSVDFKDLSTPNPGTNPHTVVLNEFLPNPSGDKYGKDDDPMPKGEWIELYNYGEFDVSVKGWKILDDDKNVLKIASKNTDTGKLIIPPKEWLVVYRNADPDFSLSNGGDTIKLVDEKGKVRDKYTYKDEAPENKSYARIPDGTGDWIDPVPTPGKINKLEDKKSGEQPEEGVTSLVDKITIPKPREQELPPADNNTAKTVKPDDSKVLNNINLDEVVEENANNEPDGLLAEDESLEDGKSEKEDKEAGAKQEEAVPEKKLEEEGDEEKDDGTSDDEEEEKENKQ